MIGPINGRAGRDGNDARWRLAPHTWWLCTQANAVLLPGPAGAHLEHSLPPCPSGARGPAQAPHAPGRRTQADLGQCPASASHFVSPGLCFLMGKWGLVECAYHRRQDRHSLSAVCSRHTVCRPLRILPAPIIIISFPLLNACRMCGRWPH